MMEPITAWSWFERRSKWLKPFTFIFVILVIIVLVVVRFLKPSRITPSAVEGDSVDTAVEHSERQASAHLAHTERKDEQLGERIDTEKEKRVIISDSIAAEMERNKSEHERIDNAADDAAVVVDLLTRDSD